MFLWEEYSFNALAAYLLWFGCGCVLFIIEEEHCFMSYKDGDLNVGRTGPVTPGLLNMI